MTEQSNTSKDGGSSRRRFLAVAGTGAAVAGVAAVAPLARADASVKAVPVDGPLVALVTNSATSEVTLMHGEKEVVVHDQHLVALLTNRLAKGV